MKTLYIGKSSENDVIIEDSFVSRKHLRISQQANGDYLLEDLGSTNGTFVNGNRVQQKILSLNDVVKIGDTILPWQSYFAPTPSPAFPQKNPLMSIRIGRSETNDFVIANPSVSQQHATLQVFADEQMVLIDNNSTNGTYVSGKKIDKSWVNSSSQIQFGNEKILISQILQAVQLPQISQKSFSSETETSKGQASIAPSKYEKKAVSKKRIPFEGLALAVLLGLAIYGGFIYLKQHKEDKSKVNLEENKKDIEKDDLADFDDEGNKIEKDKSPKEEKSPQPNSNNLEDIVENAENAIFRVDAYSNGISQGFGTGFFVKNSGIGVSNYHVFAPGNQWQIKLKNGETYEVTKILEENSTLDYIIFATNAQNVANLPIASQVPRKGQDIFVIGNPQGFELSVTKGIVSGIRNYNQYQGTASEGDNYLQIDAPISSGNSGGPVFNMNGEVVGIATMVINGKSGVAQNLNLAVNIQKLNIP
jgi:serine protease Do